MQKSLTNKIMSGVIKTEIKEKENKEREVDKVKVETKMDVVGFGFEKADVYSFEDVHVIRSLNQESTFKWHRLFPLNDYKDSDAEQTEDIEFDENNEIERPDIVKGYTLEIQNNKLITHYNPKIFKIENNEINKIYDPKIFYLDEPLINFSINESSKCIKRIDKYDKDHIKTNKPNLSYSQLITMALESSKDGKMTLKEIYSWISSTYPYFKNKQDTWHNSIRHNLTLNKSFVNVKRMANDTGKGGYWMLKQDLNRSDTTSESLDSTSKVCSSCEVENGSSKSSLCEGRRKRRHVSSVSN